MTRPVRSNECFGMELSGARELPDNLRTLRLCKVAQLVFISKTKMPGSIVGNLRWSFGLCNCLSIDSTSLSGGLALYWDESINVTIISGQFLF
jgi:hypothetical protein